MFFEEKLAQIDSILKECDFSERILLWGGGKHTCELMRYSIIVKFKNLIIADKMNCQKRFFWNVVNVSDVDFGNIDTVVISSLIYQQEIEEELKNMRFDGKIIKFYNKEDTKEFYRLNCKYKRCNFFEGDFLTIEAAKAHCTNTEDKELYERSYQSVCAVLNGYAAYELDTMPVFTKKISFHLMAWIALAASGKTEVTVADFGGALASTYLQNKDFICEIPAKVTWYIIEQPQYVKRGNEIFTDKYLKFKNSFDEISDQIDVILFSGVLMYPANLEEIINKAIQREPKYIIVDRTYIGKRSRVVLQHVSGIAGNVFTYPMKILGRQQFINLFSNQYELKYEFDSIDEQIILEDMFVKSKGFIWKRKL